MTVLDLCCSVAFPLVAPKGSYSLAVARRRLIAVAPLVVEHRL